MSRGYAAIGLSRIKDIHNFGGILRAAGCFDARFVAIDSRRLPDEASDTLKYPRHNPVLKGDDLLAFQPHDCQAVAVELRDDAESLICFKHPMRAYYLFGPEDGSLSDAISSRCQHKVFIPSRWCLNLASCVNVVLYDRMAKLNQPITKAAA